MAIEFRVHGKDSVTVAQELAEQMKFRFHVTPVVRSITPEQDPTGGASAEKIDAASVVILLVEVAVASFHAYMVFFREPSERQRQALVRNWMDLVFWARSKLPTTIRVVIGDEQLLMHESDPERLHQLTKKAIESVAVTTE